MADRAVTHSVDLKLTFARLESQFNEGSRECALHAVKFAFMFEASPPAWALAHLAAGIAAWSSAEFRTLDEALGVARPKGFRLDAARRSALFGGAILVGVNRLREEEPYSDDLFEQVGAEFGIGKTAAKEIYGAQVEYLKQRFPDAHTRIIASREKRGKPALTKDRKA